MTKSDRLAYWLQFIGARLVMAGFRVLPLDAASWWGGRLARWVGPLTGAHRTAAQNLVMAFPEKSVAARRAILRGMWDNIGRTMAEYPHLAELLDDPGRVEVVDPEGVVERLRCDGLGALLVGMHFGNWELSPVAGHRSGLKQHHFYRAPNNPYVDAMVRRMRDALRQEGYVAKGSAGARQAALLLKNKAHVGMLVDQKQNEGILVPFFGRDARTTTAPAALARRLGVPIGGGRVVRLRGARFRIVVESVTVAKSADRDADVVETTRRINAMFERWVRENPELWFWVHRRWPR